MSQFDLSLKIHFKNVENFSNQPELTEQPNGKYVSRKIFCLKPYNSKSDECIGNNRKALLMSRRAISEPESRLANIQRIKSKEEYITIRNTHIMSECH